MKRQAVIVASMLSALVLAQQTLKLGPGGIDFDLAASVAAGSKNFRSNDGVLTLAIVTHSAGSGFFNATYVGASAAALESTKAGLPVTLLRLGPRDAMENIPGQLEVLRKVLANPKLDGLAFSTPQPGAYKEVVQKAFELGIPVVTFNAYDPGLPRRNQIAHTGQSSSAASIAGQALFEDLQKRNVSSGVVLMLTDASPSAEEQNRVRYAGDAVRAGAQAKNWTDLTLEAGAQAMGVTVRSSEDVERLLASPKVVGAFASSGEVSLWLANAVGVLKRNNRFSAFGVDLGPSQLKAIENGSLTGSLGQQPFLQGYWPIKQLLLQIDRGIAASNLDTRAELVTKTNLAAFQKRVLGRFTN